MRHNFSRTGAAPEGTTSCMLANFDGTCIQAKPRFPLALRHLVGEVSYDVGRWDLG